MTRLHELTEYLDDTLAIASFPGDPSNNGLQVEGGPNVTRAVFGVDACLSLIESAAEREAEFIFTHHGLSWGGNFKRLRGTEAKRLNRLFVNGASLYSAHLPLDAHPKLGHNALLADMLKLTSRRRFGVYAGAEIGVAGKLPEKTIAKMIAGRFADNLGGAPEIFGDPNRPVANAGVISGGAGVEGVEEAARLDLDCLITGEIGHSSFHMIRDSGLTVIGLGHYLSEKPGVMAVMREIGERFDVECDFIDLPTGL